MARISALQAWLDSGHTAAEFLSRWEKGGIDRETLVKEIGYTERALYVAARNALIIPGGPMPKDGTPRKPRGSLPIKSAMAICRALGYDPEDYDQVTYENYCMALGQQGESWRDLIFNRLGGPDSDGGKQLAAWIDYHVQAELAEQRRLERESDPTYPFKVKLDGAKAEISALKATLANTQNRVFELERDLKMAISEIAGQPSVILTDDMKKLIAANALETVD